MKRIISINLVFTLVISLALVGCTPTKQINTSQEKPSAASIHNAAIADSLYDQIHVQGLKAMGTKYNIDVSSSDQVEDAKVADLARNLAGAGTDLVIFTSGGHMAAFAEVPPEFPNTWFIMIGSVNELAKEGKSMGWNVSYLDIGFIVGVVGALQTKTGKIGYIGGAPIPPIVDCASGIINGANYINPDVQVETAMIGDFVDVAKAKELAQGMIDKGVDVFYAVAGSAGRGVIEAADQADVSAIGYVSDENSRAPNTVITSVLINFGVAYDKLGEMYTKGTLKPEILPMDLKGGYITLAPFRGRVGDGVEKRALEILAQIQQGKLVVPTTIHEGIVE